MINLLRWQLFFLTSSETAVDSAHSCFLWGRMLKLCNNLISCSSPVSLAAQISLFQQKWIFCQLPALGIKYRNNNEIEYRNNNRIEYRNNNETEYRNNERLFVLQGRPAGKMLVAFDRHSYPLRLPLYTGSICSGLELCADD